MQLEKIITLANQPVRLRFLAMERSLRAVGCDLPLQVIPYNENRFTLPANSSWWEMSGILPWLKQQNAHPAMGKYQCLTVSNYHYIDSDAIFLRNPAEVLAKEMGFITSCGHWHNPGETVTSESREILRKKSTIWQRSIFNTGQFACDRALYTESELKAVCLEPKLVNTCLRFPYHEQPGLVLLVNSTDVPLQNLTLPPIAMESTWAGDYPDEAFESTWHDPRRKPYLIHWAGCNMNTGRPIDRLFTDYLTKAEQAEWREEVALKARREAASRGAVLHHLRKLVRGARAFCDVLKT